jgi:HD-like signal output (HDOD) protein
MSEVKIDLQGLDKEIDAIFPMPQTMMKMLQALGDPNVSVFQVEQILKYDPTFSLKLLSLANSAYYGSPNKISNLHMAITVLGFNLIKSMAVQASMNHYFEKGVADSAFPAQPLWKHSMGVAVCAKLLARRTRLGMAEDFFTMGILHDMGLLLMAECYPQAMATMMSRPDAQQRDLVELEHDNFTGDHAQVIQLICDKWSLPKSMGSILSYHHSPLQAPEDLRRSAAAVYLADKIVMRAGFGFAYPRGEESDAPVLPLLGLEAVDLEVLLEDFQAEAEKLSAMPEQN